MLLWKLSWKPCTCKTQGERKITLRVTLGGQILKIVDGGSGSGSSPFAAFCVKDVEP